MKEIEPDVMIRRNFDYLIKSKGLKRGDVERGIGVCAGYFSRTKHGLNLAVAYKLSKYLGVSLDDLCSKDFYKQLLKKQLQKEKEEIEKRLSELEDSDDVKVKAEQFLRGGQ